MPLYNVNDNDVTEHIVLNLRNYRFCFAATYSIYELEIVNKVTFECILIQSFHYCFLWVLVRASECVIATFFAFFNALLIEINCINWFKKSMNLPFLGSSGFHV